MSSPHLTKPNAELARLQDATPPGMAHWAGTGPDGATCAGCAHYGYFYTTTTGKSTRKTGQCEIYFKRVGLHGEKFPNTTPACKYFEGRAHQDAEREG